MEPARRRLDEQERETLRRLRHLTEDFEAVVAASKDTNADDEHDPEGATIAFERSQVEALIRAARRQLEEIVAARARLASGNHGFCESCGSQIAPERLEARPTSTMCVRCAAGAPR